MTDSDAIIKDLPEVEYLTFNYKQLSYQLLVLR